MNTHRTFSKIALLGVAFQCFSLTGCAQKAIPVAAPPTPKATTNPEASKALAFPGAEGFGKFTTGGRGGQVVVVSNLNDNGPGSLREAIRKKGPRIIVFSVSGNILLESALDINNGDLTIAGQSAPGDGICIQNYPVSVKGDNVIIRYMRFRLGNKAAQQADALGANKGANNIIIDHCSMGWATDESASFYRNQNFTLQWSIISESLNASVHAKGEHGYGGIWGGRGASFHHNLMASHNSRTPRFSGSTTTPNTPDELVDFTNNVIYNWGQNNIYGGEKGRYNMVNNYYKAGAATPKSKTNRLVNPSQPYGKFYVAGNHIEGFPEISKDNWAGGVQCDHPDSVKTTKAFAVTAVPAQEAKAAFEAVLNNAGASLKRDAVDARVVAEVRSGKSTNGKKQNGIIDSQQEVGGWPVLKSVPAPEDKDQDGMPDAWELKQKLDPTKATDAAAFTLDKQYSNVEVYLNSLVK
ncbi:pectate lyase [Rufibacter radiotolerans]|uniref:Pectate lyase n=1 Tax=Rufibacter radiotolerans TaxID=1379910 RepID=A0A0H4VHC6_9BACT|nr:pectate lyase [Rufibacter radiotolerans]AKQ45075.1 pectate lyase [Rufibacter radiotolerans]